MPNIDVKARRGAWQNYNRRTYPMCSVNKKTQFGRPGAGREQVEERRPPYQVSSEYHDRADVWQVRPSNQGGARYAGRKAAGYAMDR